MGDDLLAALKRRMFNFTLCCYGNYMDGIDYFVVSLMLINILGVTFACLD
jgi:hypothetical protein